MSAKVFEAPLRALEGLRDGSTVMVGGFGLSGNAEALIAAVLELGVRGLTLVSNNAGNLGKGLNRWLEAGIVARFIGSYIGTNAALHRAMDAGALDVELVPQGTFAERIRAGGAGIPAFYTPTGVGTVVEKGKHKAEIGGRMCLLEHALVADFALVRARVADRYGNARFWRTAQNFSPAMAMAAKTTVLECDRLVAIGELDPDAVHLPGLFVKRIIEVPHHEDVIEVRTVRTAEGV